MRSNSIDNIKENLVPWVDRWRQGFAASIAMIGDDDDKL